MKRRLAGFAPRPSGWPIDRRDATSLPVASRSFPLPSEVRILQSRVNIKKFALDTLSKSHLYYKYDFDKSR